MPPPTHPRFIFVYLFSLYWGAAAESVSKSSWFTTRVCFQNVFKRPEVSPKAALEKMPSSWRDQPIHSFSLLFPSLHFPSLPHEPPLPTLPVFADASLLRSLRREMGAPSRPRGPVSTSSNNAGGASSGSTGGGGGAASRRSVGARGGINDLSSVGLLRGGLYFWYLEAVGVVLGSSCSPG